MSLFVPKLEPETEQAFKAQRALDNVIRLRLVSAIIVAVVFWFSVVNMTFIIAGIREIAGTTEYTLLYVSFLGLNVYTLVRTFKFQSQATDSIPYRRYLERVVSGYVYLMLILSALISWADQAHYGHTMVYVLTLLLTSAFLLTDAKQLLVPLILSAILMVIGLYTYWSPGPELMHILQELFAYVPIAFVISRIMHTSYVEAWHSKHRLQQQFRENERLNAELKDANSLLEIQAITDDVTSIANRRGLNKHLDQLLAESDGSLQLSMIMIDIDFFKEFNDLYGHDRGDEVLASVAKVLADIAEELHGFVSRWGGEEFVYVATGLNKEETLGICQRIHDEVGAATIRHERSAVSKYLTVSQGACSGMAQNRKDIALCLQQADRALYRIKTSTRNGYAHYKEASA